MTRRTDELFKTVLQVLAILALAGLVGMLLHKGYADVTALAQQHAGSGFWKALARYVFRNLAG
ncbi:MAG TPA: hypothetical protein VFE82_00360 [Ramlibacter sp.]|jgi:hypothetical protein|uniref:hypothetical protein n=1 Tax=Ramlibacter sp. TaxID=1917967 RepID=UPI002D2E436F|nr:hypothetical protein [Ramlibacter sp.]HZY16896.1 hypothetical protein [Ramlibacter sp.]